MINYLLGQPSKWEFSWLALSVVTGTLESLVKGTPCWIGCTKLHCLYNYVHPLGLGTGIDPYYTKTTLLTSVHLDLSWWHAFLTTGQGCLVCPAWSSTLVPTWGMAAVQGPVVPLPSQTSLLKCGRANRYQSYTVSLPTGRN